MKLRGAISGFGEVAARAHLAGWRTRENVTLGVIHDPIAERRHEAIRLIKNVRVYDDLELMLDGEAPDFVDIASPPALHGAGLGEKPRLSNRYCSLTIGQASLRHLGELVRLTDRTGPY